MTPMYLDYNATTPVDPAVREALLPYLGAQFGNPSSGHALGKGAHAAVAQARSQVADLLGAHAEEILFTSGGSEANNHALKGVIFRQALGFFGRWARGTHVLISAVEHPAIVEPCAFLQRLGCRITRVPVDGQGLVDPDAVRRALDRHTRLVSIMHANNEIGTIQPLREIADLAHERGILVHTDAAQSVGKLPVNVDELGVDLLTVAGHKLYAPKGVGALYIRRGVKLEPFVHGAGQEAGRRAGTENVPYIVALGAASAVAQRSLPEAGRRLRQLRDRLWERLQAALGERIVLNGHPEARLPNTLNVSFLGQDGATLLQKVPELAASTGSACHAGCVQLSPVLQALGIPLQRGRGAVRLSVGRFTTEEEIDRAAHLLAARAQEK